MSSYITIENIPEYLEHCFEILDAKGNGNYYFLRGVADYLDSDGNEYLMIPSIFRKNVGGVKYEKIIYNEAMRRCPNEFLNISMLERLAKMQHYGFPTRMLDVTNNPLVSLYFACKDNPDRDACVYLFCARKVLPYDSDTAAILACFPKMEHEELEAIKKLAEVCRERGQRITPECIEDLLKDDIARKYTKLMLEVFKDRMSFITYYTEPQHLLSYHFVNTCFNNERISNQSGSFVIYGLSDEKPQAEGKILIPSRFKNSIIRNLGSLGISDATMLKDMNSISKSIVENIKHRFGNNKRRC